MNYIIDIGNTCIKTAVFKNSKLLYQAVHKTFDVEDIAQIIDKYPGILQSVLCSVKPVKPAVLEYLSKKLKLLDFDYKTPIPVKNKYATPETLGKDRLAAVVGAHAMFPGINLLVIDAGTCITYDFIDANGIYYGGSISPGIEMRFKALHNYTGKLPLIDMTNFTGMIGTTTEESILSGVINGASYEMEAIINQYKEKYSVTKVIICGGNNDFFVGRLKNSIFAFPNLVLTGLNEILKYNESSKKI